MDGVGLGIVEVTKPKLNDVARVLAQAFQSDPVMSWILPDPDCRRRRLPLLFATMLRHHHMKGGGSRLASRSDVVAGAALWDPPNCWRHGRLDEIRSLPALVRVFGRRLAAATRVFELIEDVHPQEPHWYLAVIGTAPELRGRGIGDALMTERLRRCDFDGLPAYLESSNQENLTYYHRYGFRVTGELIVPNGGPTIWPMWREPS